MKYFDKNTAQPCESLVFENIEKVGNYTDILYALLINRRLNISHCKVPSYEEHSAFVENHPYRYWYLIKKSNDFIGSIYISFENTIGLSINENNSDIATAAINFILLNYKPLPGIKSVRNENFCINTHPDNLWLQGVLKNIFNANHIQNTFVLK